MQSKRFPERSYLLAISEERPWDAAELNPLPGVRHALWLSKAIDPHIVFLSAHPRSESRHRRLWRFLNKNACAQIRPIEPLINPPDAGKLARQLERADMLWIDEGSPTNLLGILRGHGYEEVIRAFWKKRRVVIASGGGALACFRTGRQEAGPQRHVETVEGFGLIDAGLTIHGIKSPPHEIGASASRVDDLRKDDLFTLYDGFSFLFTEAYLDEGFGSPRGAIAGTCRRQEESGRILDAPGTNGAPLTSIHTGRHDLFPI